MQSDEDTQNAPKISNRLQERVDEMKRLKESETDSDGEIDQEPRSGINVEELQGALDSIFENTQFIKDTLRPYFKLIDRIAYKHPSEMDISETVKLAQMIIELKR